MPFIVVAHHPRQLSLQQFSAKGVPGRPMPAPWNDRELSEHADANAEDCQGGPLVLEDGLTARCPDCDGIFVATEDGAPEGDLCWHFVGSGRVTAQKLSSTEA